jgi:MFS family permease
VVILVYLALFSGDLSWTGLTPLIPTYVEQYDLTELEAGVVLAVASVGILVVSLPAGFITRRFSPRTMTVSATAVIAVAGLGTGLATSYHEIVLSRLVFGLGFGTLWVSMTAWLDDAAGRYSARVLALTTTIVGVSSMLGPAYSGWVAQRFGSGAPFIGLAVVSGVTFLLLLLDRSGTGLRKDPAPPARELARSARSDPDLRAMLLLTTSAALVWMTADLLVPLRLADAGYDVAAIGTAFSASSVLFIATSAITARRAERWARPRIGAVSAAALAACALVPALLPGTAAALVFLVGGGIVSGVLVALTFPFGLLAVARGAVTVAVMSALANIIWALSGLLGPVAGGASAQVFGDRAAFVILTLVCVVTAVVVDRDRGSRSSVEVG